MTDNNSKNNDAKSEYQPSEKELEVLAKHLARKTNETSPNMKVLDDGKSLTPNHPNNSAATALLMEAVGTANYDFYQGLITQLAGAARRRDGIHEDQLNFLLSVVKGIKPRDQVEAMLAAQMAASHSLAMVQSRQLFVCETIPQRDSLERSLNKLMRTFATLMETLRRYRSGGDQRVFVQQVSVSEGGQAIVGNVTQTPRKIAQDKPTNSPPAVSDARTTPMTMIEHRKRKPAALPDGDDDDV
jgi:hypothetical protein